MPSDTSTSTDPSDRTDVADSPDSPGPTRRTDGGRGTDDSLTEADVERITRRVVREEIEEYDRRSGSIWTILAGVVVGLFVLLPASSLFLSSLADAGVPVPVVAGLGLLAAAALVAYGWRLPPFR
ncbi:hypothetical protein [Candidatus Halobonum tyrrellensis]|uniref:Uncharacterized protein n=1 Tax=Candidatus Halobonum tyrrellensis G22 TaxID=1324957 RepID=V4HHM2_9EURY|nr:hypothetical protein [Candidatus Halobonum tyrrellensis]ESP87374.1 hypothetical protein K933_14848 [Candidatus Halobonum tyrrellensis G22]